MIKSRRRLGTPVLTYRHCADFSTRAHTFISVPARTFMHACALAWARRHLMNSLSPTQSRARTRTSLHWHQSALESKVTQNIPAEVRSSMNSTTICRYRFSESIRHHNTQYAQRLTEAISTICRSDQLQLEACIMPSSRQCAT